MSYTKERPNLDNKMTEKRPERELLIRVLKRDVRMKPKGYADQGYRYE
jgi:hypothetical protein